MDLDDLFIKSYLNEVNEKERKKILTSQEVRNIAKQKKDKLSFIDKFLHKFIDLEVFVNHSDQYTKNTLTMEGIVPQKFYFYYEDSSPSLAPGISIKFDHPAVVEIAIPNRPYEDGVVVIKVASHHPDSYLLQAKFVSYEAACEALAKFLGKCTTSIGKDPKKYMKEVEQKKQNNQINPDKTSHPPQNDYEVSFNKNHGLNEPATLKDSNSPTTLKKISALFHKNKNSDLDDDE